jgi:hypothetical protein
MIDLASVIPAKQADLERASELVLDAIGISADRPTISVQQRAIDFVRDATGPWGDVRKIKAVCHAVSSQHGRWPISSRRSIVAVRNSSADCRAERRCSNVKASWACVI